MEAFVQQERVAPAAYLPPTTFDNSGKSRNEKLEKRTPVSDKHIDRARNHIDCTIKARTQNSTALANERLQVSYSFFMYFPYCILAGC